MRVLVTGAGGFIGGHLVKRLIEEGHAVTAVDVKPQKQWWRRDPQINHLTYASFDLTTPRAIDRLQHQYDRVYHLAANMGGIGFIEGHKLECALSTRIDLNVLEWANTHADRLFYSSSACVYPAYRQESGLHGYALRESDAYPAEAEDGYGWQKLYTERLCAHYEEEETLSTRVARYHNIFGPHGTWKGGREKAPAALCRKVAQAVINGDDFIEIWGDGTQQRSFLFIDECVEGTLRLTESDCSEPLNIGSEEMVTINDLAHLIMTVADVDLRIKYVPGALGVAGRTSDNTLCHAVLDWSPSGTLLEGIEKTYPWVYDQVKEAYE